MLYLNQFQENFYTFIKKSSQNFAGCIQTSICSDDSEIIGIILMPRALRTVGTGAKAPGGICLATAIKPSVTFAAENEIEK